MGARDIATNAVERLRANVRTGMNERGKNATGGTSAQIDVLEFGGDTTGEAALEADSHWKFVGNGRGPGGRPPIAKLRQWIAARGLSISPYALAEKIAREGQGTTVWGVPTSSSTRSACGKVKTYRRLRMSSRPTRKSRD